MKKDKNLDSLKKAFDIEEILEKVSQKNSKFLYYIVTAAFLILQFINFFSISNIKEFFAGVFAFAILAFFIFIRKNFLGKWALRVYVLLLMVSLLFTAFTQKPFFGLLANNHESQAFYDGFSKGLYQYSIGNFDEALSTYGKLKRTVPEDETLSYYLWYMDAAIRANELELFEQLSEEIVQKFPNPTAKEARILFQDIPIARLVNTYNKGDFERLLDELSPYQNTNEEIITLFKLAALANVDSIKNQDSIESLFFQLPECVDGFDSFGYVKNAILLEMFWAFLDNSRYDLSIIALSELYSKDPAFLFETFLWVYPQQNNFINIRWISLDNLKRVKELFHEGWTQLHENGNQLYSVYKKTVTNLGLFLGITDVLQELEEEFDCMQFDEVLEGYSEHASIYNILPFYNGKYLFIILEDDFFAEGAADLPSTATQAYFYILDSTSPAPIKPVITDGSQLQIPVIMGKLFMVQKSEDSHTCLIVCIAGSGEFLSLWFFDVETESLSSVFVDESTSYHCADFIYNAKNRHCNWTFEIDNNIDSNMQTKVKGTVNAWLDFSSKKIDTQISYADPALQLYVEERNEQLIFPLANLNRLGGREIKDEALLSLIRNNCMPYYHYSQIQNSFSYMAEMYAPDISGLEITYVSDETSIPSEANYFFLVKRKNEEVQILGIYKIVDQKLKDVYAGSFLSELFELIKTA